MDDCSYCRGVRLVGWSGADPILCPTCSSGITHVWREQRKRAIEAENERDRLRSALQAAELRIAAALAECAPTQADRYDYSAKEHSELAARVRALRERAEGAEIEGKARMSGMRKKLQAAERERDEARAEVEAAGVWAQHLYKQCGLEPGTDASIIELVRSLREHAARGATDVGAAVRERDVALARAEKAERELSETHERMVLFKKRAENAGRERDEWQRYARRLEWGVARNAHRFSPRKQARWAHVKDVTGFGSSSSKVVCQHAEVDMDEEVGGD